MPSVLKSGSLDLLELSGPAQACNGNGFHYIYIYIYVCVCVCVCVCVSVCVNFKHELTKKSKGQFVTHRDGSIVVK